MKSWAVRTCAGTDWNVTVEDGDRVTIKSESSNTRFNGNVESAITHLAIALAAQEETIEELFRGRVAELEAIGLANVWLSVTQSITDIRRQWSVSAVNGKNDIHDSRRVAACDQPFENCRQFGTNSP